MYSLGITRGECGEDRRPLSFVPFGERTSALTNAQVRPVDAVVIPQRTYASWNGVEAESSSF